MNQDRNSAQSLDNNEINLKELWQTIKKRAVLILVSTALITLCAIIYIAVAKPIYSGTATLEIGQVASEGLLQGKINLDNQNNLKNIVSKKFSIRVLVPKRTTILTCIATGTDKASIEAKLTKVVDYILDRHKEKAKLYSGTHSKVSMTYLVDEIKINNTPIWPKKNLTIIMTFITGLIFSIFFVFFLEFITNQKNEKK